MAADPLQRSALRDALGNRALGVVQRAIDPEQESYVGRRVTGPAGNGSILAVMGMGYTVAFDSGPSFYVPATDLDFIGGQEESGSTDESSSTTEEPVQIFLKTLMGKTLTLALKPEHLADTTLLYEMVVARQMEEAPPLRGKPLACFRLMLAAKPIPTSGKWATTLSAAREQTITVKFIPKPVDEVDEDLVGIVKGLSPTLVVPCSHIDDTHTQDPDAKDVGTKGVKRIVSVSNLTGQQKLESVLDALESGGTYTLVLIDPSFGPKGDQVHMVQIVEYLRLRGHRFEVVKRIGSHAVTVFRCGKVTIAYVGVAVNGVTTEQLPNVGSI